MDPFNKTYWNLLQTLAWVYSGDRAIVREANDDASDSGTFWQEMRLPDGRKEPVETASRPQHENAALSLIIAAVQAGGAAYATIEEAEADILARLEDGRLTAIGVENGKGNPADVPQAFWPFLKFYYDPEPHAGPRDCDSGMARWHELKFPREQVLALWPDPMATELAGEPDREPGAAGEDAQGVSPEPIRSGYPGRPTKIKHLIDQELDRRAAASELCDTLPAEAEALLNWAKSNHADKPRPTAKTIKNNIGARYRAYRSKHHQEPVPEIK